MGQMKEEEKETIPDNVNTNELAQPIKKTTATFNKKATFALIKSVTGPTLSMTSSNGARPSKTGMSNVFSTAQT